jgi:hypothetical protein
MFMTQIEPKKSSLSCVVEWFLTITNISFLVLIINIKQLLIVFWALVISLS